MDEQSIRGLKRKLIQVANVVDNTLNLVKGHSHSESEVTNLTTDLAAKANASDLTGKLSTTAFVGLAKITVGTITPSNPSVGDLWVDLN